MLTSLDNFQNVKTKRPAPSWTGLFFATAKDFLLLWRRNLGCFIGLFRWLDILSELLELFFLLFFSFLFQFLLTLFVLVIYLSQFSLLS